MTAERCAFHARRDARSQCANCGRRICGECIQPTPVGFKCPSCVGRSVDGSRRGTSVRARSRRRTPLHARRPILRPGGARAVVAATLLALAAVAVAAVVLDREPALTGRPAGTREASAREFEFVGAEGVRIRGTLDLPVEPAARAAAVVIPGFGPATREGIAGAAVVDDLYADLGRVLRARGLHVLRYDKRGTGQSVLPPAVEELEFEHLVEDAAAAVGALRAELRLNADRVVLIGHDEGGLIALRLAPRLSPGAVVLISTPGRPLAEVVAQEMRSGGFAGSRTESLRLAREFERAVAALASTGRVPRVSPPLLAVLPPDKPRYLRAIFALRPGAEARGVGAPTLIVHGEQDRGILNDDVIALRRALVAAPSVDVIHAVAAGHTLALPEPERPAVADDEHGHGTAAPVLPERDEGTLQRIADWVVRHFRSAQG